MLRRRALKRRKKLASAARLDARKSLKRECDRLCREIVLRRAGHRCEWCGSPNKLQWAHILPRRYRHMVHEPDNALCLCVACHLFRWHKSPLEAAAWLVQHRGAAFLAALRLKAEAGSGGVDMEARLLWLKQQGAA